MSTLPQPLTESSRKRKRLTHACTQCRARKVRCDEATPRCSNCVKASTQCITLDPRNPERIVERREAQRSYQLPSISLGYSPASSNTAFQTDVARSPVSRQVSQTQESERAPSTRSRSSPSHELLPALPRHASGYGNSLYMLSQWLELAFFRLGISRRVAVQSNVTTRNVPEQPTVQYGTNPLTGVAVPDVTSHVQSYMASINTVFPIFTKSSVDRLLLDRERFERGLDGTERWGMSSILLALIVAAATQTSQSTLSKVCLDLALTNLSMIIEIASIQSVQALLLVTLGHRCRDNIVFAASMIDVAASIAQSLGMHRQSSTRQSHELGNEGVEEHILIWWSVYALEKIISMELGRLSTIRDFDCNQTLTISSNTFSCEELRDIFIGLIELSKLQSEINERFALSRHMEESTRDLNDAVRAKIEMCGDIDQKLSSWVQSLPAYIRSLNNTVCDAKLKFAVPFLALQYWQTLFALHRNALLINSRVISSIADDKDFKDKSWRFRVSSGQSICCNAARTIVSTLDETYEIGSSSMLRSSYASLIAIYALAIHIIRNPLVRLARADLEVQASARDMIAKHQSQIGTFDLPASQALRSLLDNLHSEVEARLHAALSSPTRDQQQETSSLSHVGLSSPHLPGNTPDGSRATPSDLSTSSAQVAFPIPFDEPLPFEMSNAGWDFDFSNTTDMMDLNWDTLVMAYDLPSQ